MATISRGPLALAIVGLLLPSGAHIGALLAARTHLGLQAYLSGAQGRALEVTTPLVWGGFGLGVAFVAPAIWQWCRTRYEPSVAARYTLTGLLGVAVIQYCIGLYIGLFVFPALGGIL